MNSRFGSRIALLPILFVWVHLQTSTRAFGQASTQAPTIEWSRCVGDSSDDYLYSIVQTTDGGYIGCGLTKSDSLPRKHGPGEDVYVVKFDANGSVQWQKCYGG